MLTTLILPRCTITPWPTLNIRRCIMLHLVRIRQYKPSTAGGWVSRLPVADMTLVGIVPHTHYRHEIQNIAKTALAHEAWVINSLGYESNSHESSSAAAISMSVRYLNDALLRMLPIQYFCTCKPENKDNASCNDANRCFHCYEVFTYRSH